MSLNDHLDPNSIVINPKPTQLCITSSESVTMQSTKLPEIISLIRELFNLDLSNIKSVITLLDQIVDNSIQVGQVNELITKLDKVFLKIRDLYTINDNTVEGITKQEFQVIIKLLTWIIQLVNSMNYKPKNDLIIIKEFNLGFFLKILYKYSKHEDKLILRFLKKTKLLIFLEQKYEKAIEMQDSIKSLLQLISKLKMKSIKEIITSDMIQNSLQNYLHIPLITHWLLTLTLDPSNIFQVAFSSFKKLLKDYTRKLIHNIEMNPTDIQVINILILNLQKLQLSYIYSSVFEFYSIVFIRQLRFNLTQESIQFILDSFEDSRLSLINKRIYLNAQFLDYIKEFSVCIFLLKSYKYFHKGVFRFTLKCMMEIMDYYKESKELLTDPALHFYRTFAKILIKMMLKLNHKYQVEIKELQNMFKLDIKEELSDDESLALSQINMNACYLNFDERFKKNPRFEEKLLRSVQKHCRNNLFYKQIMVNVRDIKLLYSSLIDKSISYLKIDEELKIENQNQEESKQKSEEDNSLYNRVNRNRNTDIRAEESKEVLSMSQSAKEEIKESNDFDQPRLDTMSYRAENYEAPNQELREPPVPIHPIVRSPSENPISDFKLLYQRIVTMFDIIIGSDLGMHSSVTYDKIIKLSMHIIQKRNSYYESLQKHNAYCESRKSLEFKNQSQKTTTTDLSNLTDIGLHMIWKYEILASRVVKSLSDLMDISDSFEINDDFRDLLINYLEDVYFHHKGKPFDNESYNLFYDDTKIYKDFDNLKNRMDKLKPRPCISTGLSIFNILKYAQVRFKYELKDLDPKCKSFFQEKTIEIQINYKGNLLWIYSSKIPEILCTDGSIISYFDENLDRQSHSTKNHEIYRKLHKIKRKLELEYKSQRMLSVFACLVTTNKKAKYLSLFMSAMINIIIMISYESTDKDRLYEPTLGHLNSEHTIKVLKILGIILTVLHARSLFCYILRVVPIITDYLKPDSNDPRKLRRSSSIFDRSITSLITTRNQNKTSKISVEVVLRRTISKFIKNDIFFYIIMCFCSISGLSIHFFFFGPTLFEIFYIFIHIKNILRSITIPIRSIIVSFLLMLLFVYIFTLLGYYWIYDQFQLSNASLLDLFFVIFDQGFKSGGGIGGFMEPANTDFNYYRRFWYDNMYNIIVMILLLNIIVGVVFDTYANLRQSLDATKHDKKNFCFICGAERYVLENRYGIDFIRHCKKDHNTWNYIFLLISVINKKSEDRSMVDEYIYQQYVLRDISWIPDYPSLNIN